MSRWSFWLLPQNASQNVPGMATTRTWVSWCLSFAYFHLLPFEIAIVLQFRKAFVKETVCEGDRHVAGDINCFAVRDVSTKRPSPLKRRGPSKQLRQIQSVCGYICLFFWNNERYLKRDEGKKRLSKYIHKYKGPKTQFWRFAFISLLKTYFPGWSSPSGFKSSSPFGFKVWSLKIGPHFPSLLGCLNVYKQVSFFCCDFFFHLEKTVLGCADFSLDVLIESRTVGKVLHLFLPGRVAFVLGRTHYGKIPRKGGRLWS